MLVHCSGSFLLHDMFLSFQLFAIEGQDIPFTVNVLLTCILYVYCVVPVPAVIELSASTVGRFLLRVSYLL